MVTKTKQSRPSSPVAQSDTEQFHFDRANKLVRKNALARANKNLKAIKLSVEAVIRAIEIEIEALDDIPIL